MYLCADFREGASCKRMGEAGRRKVVEQFDYRVVAKRLVEVLNEGHP